MFDKKVVKYSTFCLKTENRKLVTKNRKFDYKYVFLIQFLNLGEKVFFLM